MKRGVTKYFYFISMYISEELILLGKKEMSRALSHFYKTKYSQILTQYSNSTSA